jgi:DNA-directed RNA polymerase specialized sigma subunit
MAAKNPVEEFKELQTKEAAKRAEDDLKLWNAWDQGGRSPDLLHPLLQRYKPLLGRKLNEWRAPAVSPSAFNAELQKHFIGAAQSFDPTRGVAFNTHVQTRLRQAQRFNAKYQNIGYIPEGQAAKIGPLQQAQNELTEQFGRDPTTGELATHLDMPESRVTSLLKSLRKDVPSSAFETDPFGFGTSRENDVIRLIQKRPTDYLTQEEATVFNHIYGANGARKITDTTGLASQLGVSQPKVSRLKTSIANKIKKHM